jgi:hypothetical protein
MTQITAPSKTFSGTMHCQSQKLSSPEPRGPDGLASREVVCSQLEMASDFPEDVIEAPLCDIASDGTWSRGIIEDLGCFLSRLRSLRISGSGLQMGKRYSDALGLSGG